MRFHRTLGDVQIVGDFRVVTSLEQQIDNLPLPWSHLVELLFHKSLHLADATPVTASGAETKPPRHIWNSGLCVSFCIHAAKSGSKVLTKCENPASASFYWENAVTTVTAVRLRAEKLSSFAQYLG